ncbi:MAG: hypothetical protein ABFS39_11045 [Pseudomonadota bacterium]
MAVKKTVKKRRTIKKAKLVSIESIMDALQGNAEFSAVNKRTLTRIKKSATEVARQQKLAATFAERIDKARAVITGAKTPAAKEKAKLRLDLARTKFKEVKANLSTAVTEQKKTERLARGLYKAMEAARARMIREYDKSAKLQEKAIEKPLRRRRTSKKKVVQSPPEQP